MEPTAKKPGAAQLTVAKEQRDQVSTSDTDQSKVETLPQCQDLILGIIDEEKAYYEFANRNTPKYAMGVLRQIALAGIVAAPYSAAFAKVCDLTPGRIQNAIKLLLKEDKILEVESGIKVMDPLERVCLIVLGQDRISQAESLNAIIADLTEEE